MKTVLALMLVAACGVSHDTDDQETSPPLVVAGPKSGSPTAMPPPAYRLVPVPTGIASGTSTASKLVCAGSTVVGTQDVPGGARAIVFDYRMLTTLDLGTLGGSLSHGADGNASGTFVGDSTFPVGFGRAFVYRDGVMSELPGIGGNSSLAYAINAQGLIVGQAAIPGSGDVDQHAVLWEPGCASAIDLGTLGGGYSFTRGINEAGVIVGNATDDAHRGHVVIWGPDRVLVDLGTGGEYDAAAMDINASGQIAGFVNSDPNGGNFYHHAVLIEDGQFTDLGSLGGAHAYALGLNNRGDVVGMSTIQVNQPLAAFLYTDGAMVRLADLVDAPGWQLLSAVDICDNGVIAGNGTLDGQPRGFVLIPNE